MTRPRLLQHPVTYSQTNIKQQNQAGLRGVRNTTAFRTSPFQVSPYCSSNPTPSQSKRPYFGNAAQSGCAHLQKLRSRSPLATVFQPIRGASGLKRRPPASRGEWWAELHLAAVSHSEDRRLPPPIGVRRGGAPANRARRAGRRAQPGAGAPSARLCAKLGLSQGSGGLSRVGILVVMGTKAKVGREQSLLFTSVILCSLALGSGTVFTPEPEVRVAENKPAKLSCSYSGFSSPRVEWKFAQGDTTSLVCYNNKITASYEDRVTFSHSGITFHSVTRKDTGTYTCMVSDEGGNTYGEASVQLLVLVPPSKPTVSIPSSATIGSRAVLTCSEQDGSPPSEYYWFRDGTLMPTEPKSSRAFSNSSYTLNHKTGELVFDPVSASDTGEYMCQAQNGYGTPVRSDPLRMEAAELNVGGIVAAVLVTLILLGVLIFGIWFAYSRGYFDRMKKGTANKKVIYSQATARSEGEFRQTSSFLV